MRLQVRKMSHSWQNIERIINSRRFPEAQITIVDNGERFTEFTHVQNIEVSDSKPFIWLRQR